MINYYLNLSTKRISGYFSPSTFFFLASTTFSLPTSSYIASIMAPTICSPVVPFPKKPIGLHFDLSITPHFFKNLYFGSN